jgi:hypothetical protein
MTTKLCTCPEPVRYNKRSVNCYDCGFRLPLPATETVDEFAEFDREFLGWDFSNDKRSDKIVATPDEIKAFITTHYVKKSTVREKLEGLKVPNPMRENKPTYHKTSYNRAMDEAITTLTGDTPPSH